MAANRAASTLDRLGYDDYAEAAQSRSARGNGLLVEVATAFGKHWTGWVEQDTPSLDLVLL